MTHLYLHKRGTQSAQTTKHKPNSISE